MVYIIILFEEIEEKAFDEQKQKACIDMSVKTDSFGKDLKTMGVFLMVYMIYQLLW